MCLGVASVVQNSKMYKRYPLWDCACALAMPAFLRRSLLDLQLDALNRAKCRQIYKEQASGKNAARPELDACLKSLRSGDTLIVMAT
jgi:hypothetical protein